MIGKCWLTDAASLAMDAILARLDPDREERPFFWVDFESRAPQHSYWDFCDISGRFVDALALARVMTGRDDARDREGSLGRFLLARQDPATGLFLNPLEDAASGGAEMSKYIPGAGVLTTGAHADLFCQRAPLMAMTTLWQLGDAGMRERLGAHVHGLASIATRAGDEISFPAYRWAPAMQPEWYTPVNVPEKWLGYRYALLTPLARYAELTRDPEAVELAFGLARAYMRHGEVPADGRYRANTHSGGVLPVTVGIARLGVAFGKPELVEWARRVFVWTRENAADFGFLPDGLGLEGFFSGTCETCAQADFVHLALLLTAAGAGSYWDDIERMVRNQLLENQYRDTVSIRRTLPGITDRVVSMLRGGFECAARPNDLLTWGGAEGCCIGGGMRALYLAWRGAVEETGDETRVHMGLTRATSGAVITGHEPWVGRVDVRVVTPRRVAIRLPGHASERAVELLVDGRPVERRIEGGYARFQRLERGRLATLRYPLVATRRRYTIGGNDYTADWLGSVVMEMHPRGERHPIYGRRGWLEGSPGDAPPPSPPTGGDRPALW